MSTVCSVDTKASWTGGLAVPNRHCAPVVSQIRKRENRTPGNGYVPQLEEGKERTSSRHHL